MKITRNEPIVQIASFTAVAVVVEPDRQGNIDLLASPVDVSSPKTQHCTILNIFPAPVIIKRTTEKY